MLIAELLSRTPLRPLAIQLARRQEKSLDYRRLTSGFPHSPRRENKLRRVKEFLRNNT
jgi:hypothetical protein